MFSREPEARGLPGSSARLLPSGAIVALCLAPVPAALCYELPPPVEGSYGLLGRQL